MAQAAGRGALTLSRYRFTLKATHACSLPSYVGTALRGGLGHVLRRLVCATHLPACEACFLRHTCAFPILFQPFAPLDHPARGRYSRMPPPYVLRVPFDPGPFLAAGRLSPVSLAPGEMLQFGMIVLGDANRFLPYYVYALMQLAAKGLAGRDNTFVLWHVSALDGTREVPIYDHSRGDNVLMPPPSTQLHHLVRARPPLDTRAIRVRFRTPLRLDLDGDLVYPVPFYHLVRGVVQRWQALEACYGTICHDISREDLLSLLDRAPTVRIAADNTRWLDLERYSTRQRTRLRFGGAVGDIVYEAPDTFAPFTPLLAFAELLHVGKLTGFGFGALEVEPL